MKHSQNPKRLLAIVLVLCTVVAVAFAAGFARKINTSIVVDGKMYNNVTNFEWDMEYVIPEDGLQWDGTPDFAQITHPTTEEIGDTPDGLKYVKGQLSFVAHKQGNIGAEFDSIERLMASYGLRIIGYIAPGAFYQVETVETTGYENLQELKNALSAEETIIDGTVVLSILLPIDEQLLVSASHDTSPISDETLWHGDALDETNPMGANWGMEFINAPSVWRYDSIMNPIQCTIIDGGFGPQHNDLELLSMVGNTVHDHGTHVAGIIAAEHNNIGVSGVFHNARLSGYCFSRIIDPNMTEATYTSTPEIVFYLADSMVSGKPNVINISLGFNFNAGHNALYRQPILEASAGIENDLSRHFDEASLAIGEMLNNFLTSPDAYYDFVICQSAGNNKRHAPTLQAEYASYMAHISSPQAIVDRIIVVGAMGITQDGTPGHANFSQNGNRIDLLAPGVDIYSTITSNAYAYYSGTSMATPHVSGVAACVWSIDPEFTGAKVKQLVLNGAKLSIEPDPSDTMRTIGNDYPLLNAYSSFKLARADARKATRSGTVFVDMNVTDGIYDDTVAPNALVTLYEDGREIKSVFTNKDGEFNFSDITPGIYRIAVMKSGYEHYETANLYVKAGSTSTVTVRLNATPGVTTDVEVTGTVFDSADTPLKDVTVSVKGENLTTETDENGDYALVLPVGNYTLEFSKSGYQTAEKEITITNDNVGWTYIVDVVKLDHETKPGILSGKVVDDSGIPLYNVSVQVWGTTDTTTTDWDGNFSIELPAGYTSLNFSKKGYEDTRKSATVVSDQTTSIGIVTMAYDPTLPYVSLTPQTVGYQTQYTVTVHNPELKQVDKLDIRLVHNGIIYIDTAIGITTDCQVNGTTATFTWDDELINGASLYVTISGPAWSQEYNCLMAAGMSGNSHLPMID